MRALSACVAVVGYALVAVAIFQQHVSAVMFVAGCLVLLLAGRIRLIGVDVLADHPDERPRPRLYDREREGW